jgi:hypothetical protein
VSSISIVAMGPALSLVPWYPWNVNVNVAVRMVKGSRGILFSERVLGGDDSRSKLVLTIPFYHISPQAKKSRKPGLACPSGLGVVAGEGEAPQRG